MGQLFSHWLTNGARDEREVRYEETKPSSAMASEAKAGAKKKEYIYDEKLCAAENCKQLKDGDDVAYCANHRCAHVFEVVGRCVAKRMPYSEFCYHHHLRA